MIESQYLQLSQQKLTEFAQSSDFTTRMELAFGSQIDRSKLTELALHWQQGDFSQFPAIEILQQGELGTANGAYAAAAQKIYLSANFLATASTEQIVGVLIEEIGHFVDGVLNTEDSRGDEGALFSAIVQGSSLSATEITSLQTEDDRAWITVNGQQVLVERADVNGDNTNNVLNGTINNDVISGLGGDDTLAGLEGEDRLIGGSGSDTFTGGAGNDTIILENFNGNFFARDSDVVTDFTQGQDKIDLSGLGINDFNTLLALTSNDASNNAVITTQNNSGTYSLKITGTNRNALTAADFIFATGSVNDITAGGANNDDLFGGLGNDTLNGLAGDDRLFGEQGDDKLTGGSGSDTFTGGAGNDTIILENFNGNFFARDSDVVTDFTQGQDKIDLSGLGINDFNTLLALTSNDASNNAVITTQNNSGTYSLKITGTNRNALTAADFIFATGSVNDITAGGANNDDLFGGLGNDTLNGLAGDDRLFGEQGDDKLTGGSGSDTFTGGAGNDTIILENFNGNFFARDSDVVTDFTQGQDKIDLSGLGINDFNTLLALTSNDASNNAVITTQNNSGTYSLKITGTNRNALTAADFIFATGSVNDITAGGANNDDLFGGLGNDTLNGLAGDDRLFGEQGDDKLTGGSGSDTFIGGAGNDTIILENFNGNFFARDSDVVTDFTQGQDKIDLSGLGINDFNTLLALTSNDASDSAVITTRNNSGIYSLKITGINRSALTAADFTFATAVINDITTGGANNDDLFGGLGNDTLSGGAGDDRLFGEQGDDRLFGGAGSDTFTGGAGNDTIALENFNGNFFARDSDVVTDFTQGQDKIDLSSLGISDFNTLLALTKNDTSDNAVITTLNNSGTYDLKLTGINRSALTAADFTFATAVINDITTGGANNDDLFGGLGNDTLSGAAGDDRLFGEQGDDTLNGGGGNDLLKGQSGIDILTGGTGNDTFDLTGYDTLGNADYAIVKDFTVGDKLILSGAAIDYTFTETSPIAGVVGAALFKGTELIAIFEGIPGTQLGITLQTGTSTTFISSATVLPRGVLNFGSPTYSVDENGVSTAAITVTRTGGSEGVVSATVTPTNGTAIAPDDYNNSPIVVTFANGDALTKTITIPVVADAIVEPNETVNLTLATPTGGATIGQQSSAVLTIIDRTILPQPGVLNFSSPTYSVNEDGTAFTAVTVTRTGGTQGIVSATVTPSNGTATAPGDYNNSPITVTFADGDAAAKVITIPVVNDTLIEFNETVNLTLSAPVGGATIGTQSTSTLTIIDNDGIPLIASSANDPHLKTFDRLGYDFQAVGEFTLVKSTTDDFEIQTRQQAWNNSTSASANSAISINSGGQRIALYANQSQNLIINVNGAAVTLADGGFSAAGQNTISRQGNLYKIITANQDVIQVNDRGAFLNINLGLAANRRGTVVGLLGNNNGSNSDEFALRDGTAIGATISNQRLYGDYGNSWRIAQATSLFDYAAGTNTSTFTNLNFPQNIVNISSITPEQRAAAELTARNAGITDPDLLNDAIVDIVLTNGAPEFIQGSVEQQQVNTDNAAIIAANPIPVVLPPVVVVTPPVVIAPPVVVPPVVIVPPVVVDPPVVVAPPVVVDPPVVIAPPVDVLPPVLIAPPVDVVPPVVIVPPVGVDSPGVGVPPVETTPVICISNAYPKYGHEGDPDAAHREFDIYLSHASTETITVEYSTVDGTAIGDEDFEPIAPTTLTFAPGETCKTISVAILDDNVHEYKENFLVELSNATHATIELGYHYGMAKIIDDDLPGISIDCPDDAAYETDSDKPNSGKFTFKRTGSTTDALEVNYTIEGSAINGTDYTTVEDTITFAAGSDTSTIEIKPIDDLISEGVETVTFKLDDSESYTIVGDKSETANITELVPDLVLPVKNLDKFVTSLQNTPEGELINCIGFAGQTLKVDTVSTSDAAYQNYIGFYAVEDAQGTLANGLKVGDAGYAEAAIKSAIMRGFKTETQTDLTVSGGKIFAPVVIANGTFEDFLNRNPQNQANSNIHAYFNYTGANTDGVDHFRLLGDNKFGVEDLYGGGDRDYNDIVIQLTVKG